MSMNGSSANMLNHPYLEQIGDKELEANIEKLRKMRMPRQGPIKTVKVVDILTFAACVFGGDCFLKNFPNIVTTGVRVQLGWGCGHQSWYVIDENGNRYNDTAFFSEKEMVHLVEVPSEGV